jgi:hypothetical protein
MTMAVPYTLYYASSGEIITSGIIGGSADMKDLQIAANIALFGDDCVAMEVDSDPKTQYVQVLSETPTVVDRPNLQVGIDKTSIIAGGDDYLTLTGLPDPCEIIIDAPDPTVETMITEVSGGGFEFEAATPGIYTIEVRRFPFLPLKIEVTAT